MHACIHMCRLSVRTSTQGERPDREVIEAWFCMYLTRHEPVKHDTVVINIIMVVHRCKGLA